MNASARASDLIMVASRLVVLMEQEIAILHEMKVADIAELQPEKELLVRAYREHGRALEEVYAGRPEEHAARPLYEEIYCARGDIENRIKECQMALFADRTSAATMNANQLRLWFASMA